MSGIIDFHQADYAPRALDLAVAVERNCFFWNRISDGDDGAYDLGHVAALVGAYGAVAPPTHAEREAFADVLQACQFEYGISFLDYYWGVEHDREKADWAWETFVVATPAGGSQSRSATRMPPSRGSPAPAESRRRSGRAFTSDSSTSSRGVGVPHDAAADPEVDLAARDRERADREPQGEVAVGVDAADRPHRGAPADGLEPGDVLDRRQLRCARDRPAGERRARGARRVPTPARRRPSTVETRWRTPAIGRSSRNVLTRTDPGDAHAAEVVSLEVDDHHVLGPSLPLAAMGSVASAGRVPLIGLVQTRSPRVRRKSSGVAETIDQPSPCIAAAHSAPSGASARSTPAGSPRKGARMCWTRFTW